MRANSTAFHFYPSGGVDLRAVLAEEYGTKIDNVIVGSGSDSIISNIVRTFLGDHDEILTTEAAFIGFQVVAKSRGVPYRTVPLRQWQYDLEALADAVNEHTKIIYLANPNNPTGTIFTRQQFESFYKHIPERVLIILDEAYFEYAKYNPRYPDSMHYRLDNVITLRTFSKVYGLAGLRVGYGFAHEDLIRNLLKVKLPFEPSSLAEAAGIAALRDKAFLHRSLELNVRGMDTLSAGLRRRGFEVVPSEANFVMAVLPDGRIGKGTGGRPAAPRSHHSPAGGFRPAAMRSHLDWYGRRKPNLSGSDRPSHFRQPPAPGNARYREQTLKGKLLCKQSLKKKLVSNADFLPLHGTDHVEFYVGNAKQAAHFYRSAFGMKLVAYCGPETGVRDRASYVFEQGKVRFVLTTALGPDHPIAAHVNEHGDSVKVIALWVDDAAEAWRRPHRGAAKASRNRAR